MIASSSSSSDEEEEMLLLWLVARRRRRRQEKNARKNRRWWVYPLLTKRQDQGSYSNLIHDMRNYPEKFYNYHRMSAEQFDLLLGKIEPVISRSNVFRESISPGLRLALTLRYVASGDSMVSLAYQFLVGQPTVSQIIKETATAIWDVLQNEVLNMPKRDDWNAIGADFENMWNFPNCMGAIDGKHVVVQCFSNTGSNFYNYKGTFSVVLLGICDAKYRFTYVSIGSSVRESDGGIFQRTDFATALDNDQLDLPPALRLPRSSVSLPVVFVGDAAFPLKKNLMRPYPGANLNAEEVIFNYRLSRARRMIENTFGVLSARYRIFRKPIIATYDTVVAIIKCCVCLHNWHIDNEEGLLPGQRRYIPPLYVDSENVNGHVENGLWRNESQPAGMVPIERGRDRNPTTVAKNIRDEYRNYFMREGAIPWQWNKLPHFQTNRYLQAAQTARVVAASGRT